MLGAHYRFQVKNETGLNLTAANVAISFRPWKFATDGALVLGAEVGPLNPSGDVANGAVGATSWQDNTGDLYLGLTAGHFVVTTDSGTLGSRPQVVLYVQTSPDGTKTPDDETGWIPVVAEITAAAVAERRDFEV